MCYILPMKEYLLITEPSQNYELIDSGGGYKLERFGAYVLARPDPQAIWAKGKIQKSWDSAHGYFTRKGETGKWTIKNMPDAWEVLFDNITFELRPTSFKHTGLFPEQAVHWDFMVAQIKKAKEENKEINVLNLFAYTGGASIACAKAGANVVHVDGSKTAIAWAKKNGELSHVNTIRFMLDDVMDFLKREARRGNKYDGIVLDPPSFGRGPKQEVWKIDEQFLELAQAIDAVLVDEPLFVVASGYASGFSPIAYHNVFSSIKKLSDMKIESGELAIKEGGEQGRLLPAGMYWRCGR